MRRWTAQFINIKQIRKSLSDLIGEGLDILKEFHESKNKTISILGETSFKYQTWFTRSLSTVKQIIPDRTDEFISYYKSDPKRKRIDAENYSIADYLHGLRKTDVYGDAEFDHSAVFLSKLSTQIQILQSALDQLNWKVADIVGLLQAHLFDREIDAARELESKGHLRAAGTLAGVTIERHLAGVCKAHSVTVRKKNPSISDLNDALKNAGVIDVPNWRLVQRLGDLRNLCAHSKAREPTKDEVEELLVGIDKALKTIL